MSAISSIEWTDRTWNPVRGCARVSPGCERCYAERVAYRFGQKPGSPYEGLTVLGKKGPRWNGRARFVPAALAEPLSWRKPQRVFVNSMSDLFHEDVTNEQIAAVFGVMATSPRHTFQVLTKRPERMLEWFAWADEAGRGYMQPPQTTMCLAAAQHETGLCSDKIGNLSTPRWPLPNVWLGVSCEDQQRADERIPLLLQCPAAVRFVSAEPLLGPIDFTNLDADRAGHPTLCQVDALTGRNRDMGRPCLDAPAKLDWVIVGGESGPHAREHNVAWSQRIVDQCVAAGVPVFQKQLGAHVTDRNDAGFHGDDGDRWPADTEADFDSGDRLQGALVRIRLKNRKGGDMAEWPEDLRVREMPRGAPP